MIKAVLLDLDDTLIETTTNEFFAAYMSSLGVYSGSIAPPETFSKNILQTYGEVLKSPDSTQRLYERFLPKFAKTVDRDAATLDELFKDYYRDCFSELSHWIKPREATARLLDFLFENGYDAVVATNPGLPEAAINQRMEWGNIGEGKYPFKQVTTLENMHFGKPQPEYFEEILLNLNLDPGEAIMVGDDWEQDIVGAATAGLCTYWITENGSQPPDPNIPISGFGTYEAFVSQVTTGWLDGLAAPRPNRETLLHRLMAFPGALDTVRRTYRAEIMECRPDDGEWSARDIICHLRDHEGEEDRARLERILIQDNPFLSANYDPWAHVQHYSDVSANEAFVEFAALRMKTVKWLAGLPADAWSRPARYAIFGPTNFEEMVRFTTEHDLTHMRQMLAAIDHALITCGP